MKTFKCKTVIPVVIMELLNLKPKDKLVWNINNTNDGVKITIEKE